MWPSRPAEALTTGHALLDWLILAGTSAGAVSAVVLLWRTVLKSALASVLRDVLRQDERLEVVGHELTRNHGTSLKDAVHRTDRRTEVLEVAQADTRTDIAEVRANLLELTEQFRTHLSHAELVTLGVESRLAAIEALAAPQTVGEEARGGPRRA